MLATAVLASSALRCGAFGSSDEEAGPTIAQDGADDRSTRVETSDGPYDASDGSDASEAGRRRRAVADFNGDGKTDIAVFRPSTHQWLVKGIQENIYGEPTDVPLPLPWAIYRSFFP